MARYQLRRPTPITVVPKRFRRQATAAPAPEEEEEEEEEEEDEGPESPDSPGSSPSTVGGSESEDSESDDDEEPEAPSPVAGEQAVPSDQPTLPPSDPNMPAISSAITFSQAFLGPDPPAPTSVLLGGASQLTAVPPQGTDAAASQITGTPSMVFVTRPANTNPVASAPTAPTDPLNPGDTVQALGPAQSETAGQDQAPQLSSPQEERTMLTKGGMAAAITLSIVGAIAIVVAAVVLFKRRKRRQYNQRLPDDPFNPGNTSSVAAPEIAHIGNDPPFYGAGGGSHLTRSTNRSDSLFGAAPYTRPETVSTQRNRSRFPVAPAQPTPNPFVDPPLNKAYDVLAGRPRSTTLTDRGSWVKNPFRNPESERFDPFGELQEKARLERKRFVEQARLEAEAAREAEVKRQFGQKEMMGLGMPDEARRKGSGVTIEGLGVLDRSADGAGGGATYRSV